MKICTKFKAAFRKKYEKVRAFVLDDENEVLFLMSIFSIFVAMGAAFLLLAFFFTLPIITVWLLVICALSWLMCFLREEWKKWKSNRK